MEEDIQGDWLDRFYTMIKVGLILMTLYNYNTSDSFLAIILSIFTFMLYQGGFFRLQRRYVLYLKFLNYVCLAGAAAIATTSSDQLESGLVCCA